MQQLITDIVKALVDFPEDVTVTQIESANTLIFEVDIKQEDVGKVIGKRGRIINSLRTIIKASAAKNRKRAMIELVSQNRS